MDIVVLEQAIEHQYSGLLQEALCILKQPQDAEDAVQTACLKAWLQFPNIAVNVCAAWLRVIVYRECITILRKRSRRGLSFDTEMLCILCDAKDWIGEYLEKQSLNEMIETLPSKYASLLKLRYYDGMGISEIANQLQQPASTVRSRLFRARHMMYSAYRNSTDRLA